MYWYESSCESKYFQETDTTNIPQLSPRAIHGCHLSHKCPASSTIRRPFLIRRCHWAPEMATLSSIPALGSRFIWDWDPLWKLWTKKDSRNSTGSLAILSRVKLDCLEFWMVSLSSWMVSTRLLFIRRRGDLVFSQSQGYIWRWSLNLLLPRRVDVQPRLALAWLISEKMRSLDCGKYAPPGNGLVI